MLSAFFSAAENARVVASPTLTLMFTFKVNRNFLCGNHFISMHSEWTVNYTRYCLYNYVLNSIPQPKINRAFMVWNLRLRHADERTVFASLERDLVKLLTQLLICMKGSSRKLREKGSPGTKMCRKSVYSAIWLHPQISMTRSAHKLVFFTENVHS